MAGNAAVAPRSEHSPDLAMVRVHWQLQRPDGCRYDFSAVSYDGECRCQENGDLMTACNSQHVPARSSTVTATSAAVPRAQFRSFQQWQQLQRHHSLLLTSPA